MVIPTVAIHHPLAHDVRMVINASDFVEGEHHLWTEPQVSLGDLRIAKGARGLWFVKRDGEAVTTGFKTEVEAQAALADMS
jgi:hypothetical protein